MSYSPEILLQLLQRFSKSLTRVRQVHALFITNAHFLCNTEWKNTLLYNALIGSYLSSGQPRNSLLLFADMLSLSVTPNSHTFSSLLKAVTRTTFSLGASIHAQALRRGVTTDPFVATSFLVLYANAGDLRHAHKMFDEIPHRDLAACNAMLVALCKNGDSDSAVSLFDSMPERDVVTWTSLVDGLRTVSQFSEAVRVFAEMLRSPVKPNEATYVSVISCCVGHGGLGLGKQIHGFIIRNESIGVSVNAATSLIDLYGRNGMTKAAENVFGQMWVKETCVWNAAIMAFASNGEERKALTFFGEMRRRGSKPNEVTFVAVLTACARAGFIELGLEIFGSMLSNFGVVPVMEHYGCVVGLLGRTGLLAEAEEFLTKMPFKPDGSVLGVLLGACETHGATELGLSLFDKHRRQHLRC